MSILSALKQPKGVTVQPGLHPGDPALVNYFGNGATNSAQLVNSDTAMRVSAVYACVTIHAQTLGMIPCEIKRLRPDGGSDIAPDHRLYKQLTYRANRWQTPFEFIEMMQGHRFLRGNAYAQIVYNIGTGINELIPLHPDRVYPFCVTTENITIWLNANSQPIPPKAKLFYQYIECDGTTTILRADDVLHIRGYSSNGIVGINPIQYHRESIGLAMATEEHGARLFSNGAQVDMVVKHPAKLGDVAYERLKKEFNDKYSGVSNSHRPVIFEEGMSIEKVGMTNEDSQFLESRKYQVEDIARIFNMPLVLIGHSGDKNSTYASSEQMFISFVRHTMAPEMARWEQAMKKDLLYPSEIGTYTLRFNAEELLRGDMVAQIQYLKGRFETGSISPDEIRTRCGENPTGTEEGKKYYLGSGIMPIAQAIEQTTATGANNGE